MAAPASSNSLQFASLYVGDLHPEVSEATLYEAFSQAGTVASCRVCRDNVTRKSLGYGYVNFGSVQEAERALEMLNYMSIKGKPCRVMWSQRDPERRKNTASNVFVKGLDPTIDNKALHDTFSIFGNILSCKVSTDDNGKSKGYGFVHYEKEEAAKEAILKVNGMKIADSTVFVGPFIKREERDDTINETFTNLYVRNMPPSWDDAKVAEIFSDFGEVSSSVLLNTDDGKRFALVNFKQPEAAKAAVEALHKKDMRSEMGTEKADEAPESEKKDEKEEKEEKEDGKEEETGDKEGETGKEEHPEHLLYVQRAQTRAERKAALEEERKKRKEAKGEGKGKDKGVRLCIRNIAEEVTAEKLRELMEPFDTILAVILRCDEETGKNRGVGFVVMSSMEGATKAIEELNGQELEGKALNVAFSERRGRGERADGSTAKGKAEGKGKGGGRGKGKGKGGKGVAATIIPGPLSPFQAPPMMRPMGPMPGMPSMPVSGMPGGMPVYPFPQGPRGVPSMPGMPGMRPFGVPGQMPHPMPHPMPHAMPHRPMMPMPGAPGAPMPGMPAPMPPPAALGPFNKEAIEKMPPQQQKQQLGERLYASNFRLRPDLAGKLTGMMLELSNTEILGLLESDEKLKHKIDEAVKILDQKK